MTSSTRAARALDDGSGVLAPRVVPAFARMVRAELDRWERQNATRVNPELRDAQRVLERADAVRRLAVAGSVDGTKPASVSDPPGEGALMDTHQAAALAGVTPRSITKRAAAGKIPGARKLAGRWLIPADEVSA